MGKKEFEKVTPVNYAFSKKRFYRNLKALLSSKKRREQEFFLSSVRQKFNF